jgi:hypothetical protein
VHGLWVYNWSDRLSNDGALVIMGKWSSGVDVQLDGQGLSSGIRVMGRAHPDGGAYVAPADTTALRISGVPVALAGRTDRGEVAFVRGRADGEAVLSAATNRVAVGAGVTLRGSDRMRGQAVLSGDGETRTFRIAFAQPFEAPPYVVASGDLPVGMGVAAVETGGFDIVFAVPPPAGEDNIRVTWMAME